MRQHHERHEQQRQAARAAAGLTSHGTPFKRQPYKTARIAQPSERKPTKRELERAAFKAQGLTRRGTVPKRDRTPVEAIKARAALAVDRQEAARADAAKRKADMEAAAKAHAANPAVQLCRLERARKTERDNALVEIAKIEFDRFLADVPAHRRGRPRKNTGAAA